MGYDAGGRTAVGETDDQQSDDRRGEHDQHTARGCAVGDDGKVRGVCILPRGSRRIAYGNGIVEPTFVDGVGVFGLYE